MLFFESRLHVVGFSREFAGLKKHPSLFHSPKTQGSRFRKHKRSLLRGASFSTHDNLRLVVGGDGVGQNWVVFSAFPHQKAASGLDGTGPFWPCRRDLLGRFV